MGRGKKAVDKVVRDGDKLLRDGFAIASARAGELEQKRQEYLRDMRASADNVETIMNSYAMRVYQSYLPEVSRKYLPVWSAGNFDTDSRIRFFDITKWVIDAEEKNMDKLVNVYQVLSGETCNIALIYQRFVTESRVMLAVSNTGEKGTPDVADGFIDRIEKSLRGNFPGVQISDGESGTPLVVCEDGPDGRRFFYNVVGISNLPSEKSEDFVSQSMEKLLDGIVPAKEEEEYTLVLLATPFQRQDEARAELAQTYSVLSPFMQWQTNVTVSEGKIVGTGVSTGYNVGAHMGIGGEEWLVSFGFQVGASYSRMVNDAEQVGKAEGETRNFTDYAVKHLLDTIERQYARMEESTALGMWNFAAYALSADPSTASDVAHMYLSLTQGENSFVSKAAVNFWEGGWENEKAAAILDSISRLKHPEFTVSYEGAGNKERKTEAVIRERTNLERLPYPGRVSLTTVLSGKDLARALNFPRKSVSGLPVVESVPFGREVHRYGAVERGRLMEIGRIYHMHSAENRGVSIDIDSLCAHTFIAGSTGKGKSNTIYRLLEKVCERKKEAFRFLVIEPVKGEYKDAFYRHPEISVDVYGTNPKETELLRINPFEFPEEIHVLEHVDRLTEIFNACWPMYAAMPAILKNAIIRSYISCGWDMLNSVCETKEYPSFSDVLWQIREILKSSDFSDDNKGDYTGALCTRVESLTTGLNGMIFTPSAACTPQQLFCKNVIVDLSRVGSPETKALIMSMLVMKLQEFRMSERAGMNLPLRHITVLEEAHNILKRTSLEQGAEISNIQGKAVETMANAIAEMRTYGEGFIIADQAPGLLDASVIRNTNTKIILCLPEEEDRLITGHSMGLRDDQIREMAKLERGVAVVYQNDWQEAVLCRFDKYHKGGKNEKGEYPLDRVRFQYDSGRKLKTESEAKREILEFLLSGLAKPEKIFLEEQRDRLVGNLDICRISFEQKRLLKRYLESDPPKTLEEAAPLAAILYDVRKIPDNRTAASVEEWNRQILDRLDLDPGRLGDWYCNLLLKCLMLELAEEEPSFVDYAYKWELCMERKDVR